MGTHKHFEKKILDHLQCLIQTLFVPRFGGCNFGSEGVITRRRCCSRFITFRIPKQISSALPSSHRRMDGMSQIILTIFIRFHILPFKFFTTMSMYPLINFLLTICASPSSPHAIVGGWSKIAHGLPLWKKKVGVFTDNGLSG